MELRDYLNVLRARKWVVFQAAAIVTIAALVFSLVQPKQYEGHAKVLVSEKDTGAALFGQVLPELSSQPERGLQTQVQLMQLRPLAEETVRALGLEMSPDELLKDVTVAAIGQTNVVTISVRADDPETAAEIANTLADEYVTWSRETKRESIKSAADEVEARLRDAEAQIRELARRIQAEGKSDELTAEISILTGTYTTLAEKLEQLRINEQLEQGSGRVVAVAVAEFEQVEPRPLRNVTLGLIVGLIFGVAMAFLYEYLDNTIKSTEEAERLYQGPVLGIIPVEKLDKGEKRRLTIVEQPGSAAAEAYRILRNSLDFVNFEHKIRTLLITSATPGEGKSTVAANLAASLARAGKKVVLIACDFRRPTTEQFFTVNNLIGLSDVLLGTHTLKAALQRPGDESLLILTSGKMPPNPSELLGSMKMKELLDELSEWADWVILDTPPVLAVADPVSVARWTDGVLVVSKAGTATREAASKAVELLGKVGAEIIGVAVWGLDESRNRPGYGYGYYTGGYQYYDVYARRQAASAAGKQTSSPTWAPEESPGRRAAMLVGRVLSIVLGFVIVVAVAALIAYFLDQYFGWGLVDTVSGLLS